MLEKFIFENHLGQVFNGLENDVYLNYNDLRDYAWEHETLNNRISRFYQSITTRKLPLVVMCQDVKKAIEIKNKLCDMAEVDIHANLPGKIYVGEYYMVGYITASTKAEYLIDKRYCRIDLTLTVESPQWMREHTYAFIADLDGSIGSEHGTDYPYDYQYDYALSLIGRKINCNSIGGSEFKLLVYGPAVDPSVIIGNHAYTVKGSLLAGETLLIDSVEKTITLTTATGSRANWYNRRDRANYIFEPIPDGVNTVSWNGDYGFDLTVIEKRSEPRWT